MPRKNVLILGLCGLLAACATLSKEECLSGSWREIGLRDGRDGRTAAHLARHAKACEKTGVLPDRAEWERGRQAGLVAYCTPERAYQEGRSGRSLSPVCPTANLVALEAAYRKGERYHAFTTEIRGLEREIRNVENEIADEDDADRRSVLLLRLRTLRDRVELKQEQRRTYARL